MGTQGMRVLFSAFSHAQRMLGVREDYVDGKWTNWGPEIKQFLYAAGVNNPAPWCAAFVNWCAEQAAKDHDMPSRLEEVPLQAYVQSYYDWADKENLFIDPERAGPGDLFVLYYPSLKRYGHIGFVKEVNVDEGWFTTIEGNTNDDAAREGYEVAERKRTIKSTTRFIRWN